MVIPLHPVPLVDDDPILVGIEQMAAATGLPVRTLRYLRAQGEGPPCSKPGRHLIIRRSELRQWLDDYLKKGRK
jgi:hypothetical protein